jgi:ferritin-like metal-binding protein YciE
MDDLLHHGLEDVYNAEHRIRNSLPKLTDKAALVALR